MLCHARLGNSSVAASACPPLQAEQRASGPKVPVPDVNGAGCGGEPSAAAAWPMVVPHPRHARGAWPALANKGMLLAWHRARRAARPALRMPSRRLASSEAAPSTPQVAYHALFFPIGFSNLDTELKHLHCFAMQATASFWPRTWVIQGQLGRNGRMQANFLSNVAHSNAFSSTPA